ncbi:MAG: PP2C family protein-serine/threonine phosphatase [Nocardioidaceae bacterium]
MSLRLRVSGLLAILALIFLGTSLVMALTLSDYDSQRILVRETLQPAADANSSLLTALLNEETGERGYLITGRPQFLQPYRAGRRSYQHAIHDLQTTLNNPDTYGWRPLVRDIQARVARWQRVGVQPEIAARRAGDLQQATSLVALGRSKHAFDDVRAAVDALQDKIDARLLSTRTAALNTFAQLKNALLTAGVLMVVLFGITAVLLRRWVLDPVSALRANMREVAGGDIDRRVLVVGPPEVAAIAHDAEGMRQRIVSELDTARAATEALQQHSPVVSGLRTELEASSVENLPGVRVFGVLHPAEGVLAGDWWEAVRRASGTTALLIADVAGHGAEAGLVALRFKQRITVLLRTDLDLLTAFMIAAEDLDEDAEKFLSCVLAEVDPTTGTVRWINAGHSAALVARHQGGDEDGKDVVVQDLHPTGPLIGALEHKWRVEETTLGPGDLLIAMTDGVVEARKGGDEEFGISGVVDTLRSLERWSPRSTVTELAEAVRTFADDWRRDDVTLVALDLDQAAPAIV